MVAELLKFWTEKIIEIEPTERERSSLDLLLETCLSSGLQEQLSTQEASEVMGEMEASTTPGMEDDFKPQTTNVKRGLRWQNC